MASSPDYTIPTTIMPKVASSKRSERKAAASEDGESEVEKAAGGVPKRVYWRTRDRKRQKAHDRPDVHQAVPAVPCRRSRSDRR